MSKFFQQKFAFSNEEAGTLVSLPYTVLSVTMPFFGHMLTKAGKGQFKLLFLLSMLLVLSTHLTFALSTRMALAPILVFGLGHGLLTTL